MNIKTLSIVIGIHLLPLAALLSATTQPSFQPIPELPSPLPLPSPAPIPSQQPPLPVHPLPPASTYTVKPGDTRTKIVKRFKLNYNTLLKINNIKDPNKLVPGQVLKFVK